MASHQLSHSCLAGIEIALTIGKVVHVVLVDEDSHMQSRYLTAELLGIWTLIFTLKQHMIQLPIPTFSFHDATKLRPQ